MLSWNWNAVDFIFGAVVLAGVTWAAVKIRSPTPLQYNVLRTLLAVSCSAVASALPGLLTVRLGGWLQATGAIGVFAVVYFFEPRVQAIPKPARDTGDMKPGDRIRVRPGGQEDVVRNGIFVAWKAEMKSYRGQVGEIIRVKDEGEFKLYVISLDREKFQWDATWLELCD